MPDVRSLDPTMRQRLAQTFNGDAKPGSIRANLVKGLLGSQTGDDSGLVGMTPLGPIMQAADSSGGRGSIRNTLEAAAGMIPGSGKGIGEALQALHPAEQAALSRVLSVAGSTKELGEHTLQEVLDLVQRGRRGVNPNDTRLVDSAVTRLTPDNPVKEGTIIDHATLKPSNLGAGNFGGSPRPEAVPTTSRDLKDRRLGGNEAADLPASKEEADDIRAMHEPDLHDIAGGDAAKMNFIKNAMEDEGGNLPEDVAMTLLDHMSERDPDQLHALAGEFGIPLDDDLHSKLRDMLVESNSIPEMLGMHYDLNPELLSKAYKTPEEMSAVGRTPRRDKPTQ